jgi:ABC-2 type transport system permease protein
MTRNLFLWLHLVKLDLKIYFRNTAASFWTFVFPAVLITLLTITYGRERFPFGNLDVEIANQSAQPIRDGLADEIISNLSSTHMFKVVVADPERSRTTANRAEVMIILYEEIGIADGARLSFGEVKFHSVARPEQIIILDSVRQTCLRWLQQQHRADMYPLITATEDNESRDAPLSYPEFILTGMVGMILLSTCLYGFCVPMVHLRSTRYFQLFSIWPISVRFYISSFYISRVLIVFVYSIVMMVFAKYALGINITIADSSFARFLIVDLTAICAFFMLGIAVSNLVSSAPAMSFICNMMYYPLLFLSDVFAPVRNFPDWMSHISRALPTYWVITSFRAVLFGHAGLDSQMTTIVALGMVAALASAMMVAKRLIFSLARSWQERKELAKVARASIGG